MAEISELLTPTEAAVVSRVSVRDVHRVIDESILPEDLLSADDGRHVVAAGCSLINFYFSTARRLTSEERLWTIGVVGARLRGATSASKLMKEDWTFRDEFLAIDFKPFLHQTCERLRRLGEARALVVRSPDILSGTPVIRGTRVPVYDVAASVSAGIPMGRILAAYPSLDADKVELAALYGDANPPRGRPRQSEPPEKARVVSEHRRSRRRKAG
jgi:uncharacterized protein (DUF433 family)